MRPKKKISGSARCLAFMMSELVVKELTPYLRDDFLLFFDHVAFVDNPDIGLTVTVRRMRIPSGAN